MQIANVTRHKKTFESYALDPCTTETKSTDYRLVNGTYVHTISVIFRKWVNDNCVLF